MKYNLILVIFIAFSIVGMEKEQEEKREIFLQNISITDLNAEKSKFKKYDLDHPEKFLNLLRTRLNKETNLIKYLESLQLFASKLQAQHIIEQNNSVFSYLYTHLNQLHQKNERILSQVVPEQMILKKRNVAPETSEQVNEILANPPILGETRIYSPKELKIIFKWILNPKYGSWLNKIALSKAYTHLALITIQLLESFEFQNEDLFIHLLDAEFDISNNYLIIENTQYLTNVLNAFITLSKKMNKQKDKTKASQEINKVYENELIKIANLYSTMQHNYEQLYKIIRQEMRDVITELIKTHQPPGDITFIKSLVQYNLSLPVTVRQQKIIPEQLPSELQPLKDPKDVIILPSLDEQLQQAAKEMGLIHPIEQSSKIVIKPKKEKRKQHRKKSQPKQITPEIQEESEEETEVLSEPKKIVESKIDSSYILEGEETDKNITIHNPKNNTIEVIFKTDKPNQITQTLPLINYTQWVQMWFKDPQNAIETQGYTKEGTKKFTPEHMRWKPIALHAFSRLVDTFIKQWGTATIVPSRKNPGQQDLLVTLPGKIIYPDGTEETGVFAYLIDSKNGMWYHRMFEPQTGQKLISDLFEKGYFSPEMKGYYDVFFPELPKKK